MHMSIIAFTVMAAVTVLIMAATMASELNLELLVPTQTGDSSLSRQSVNWLAAVAFIAALGICMV